ncbi:MAG: transposase [Bacteroides fragilis]|nr:transposase [Bacteroides fragilis]
MPVKYKYRQLSLKDAFSDCQDMFLDDAPSFFQLLEEYFDIQEFIPSVFRNAFYQHFGRKRAYPLEAFLSALILQKIFSIPSDSLLLLFLRLSKEFRDFCGFSKVPDASLLTRFKQDFGPYIELYVSENNPKTLNALIKKLKTYYKDKPKVDPCSMAYGLMPSHAASLIPVLTDYFSLHPGFHPDVFPGDSSFNTAAIYGALLHDFRSSKALIPYNPRNESSLKKVGCNEYGYPTCPDDPLYNFHFQPRLTACAVDCCFWNLTSPVRFNATMTAGIRIS